MLQWRSSLWATIVWFAFSQVQSENTLPSCLSEAGRAVQCGADDQHCGVWHGRSYTPKSCTYRPVSSSDARHCLANRTLAFIGDSMLRDIANGVAQLLEGTAVEDVPNVKFDKHGTTESRFSSSSFMGNMKSWKFVPDGNAGLIYPPVTAPKDWQIQFWGIRSHEFLQNHQLDDILNNKMRDESPHLRKIDIAFWTYGLHEQEAWKTHPYGENYYNAMVKDYLETRQRTSTPFVYTSMNENCAANDPIKGRHAPGTFEAQSQAVKEANAYTMKQLREQHIPFYDLAAPLRTPQICHITDDVVHVKMWVDLVRAQILLNYLCDENNNWIGSNDRFV